MNSTPSTLLVGVWVVGYAHLYLLFAGTFTKLRDGRIPMCWVPTQCHQSVCRWSVKRWSIALEVGLCRLRSLCSRLSVMDLYSTATGSSSTCCTVPLFIPFTFITVSHMTAAGPRRKAPVGGGRDAKHFWQYFNTIHDSNNKIHTLYHREKEKLQLHFILCRRHAENTLSLACLCGLAPGFCRWKVSNNY